MSSQPHYRRKWRLMLMAKRILFVLHLRNFISFVVQQSPKMGHCCTVNCRYFIKNIEKCIQKSFWILWYSILLHAQIVYNECSKIVLEYKSCYVVVCCLLRGEWPKTDNVSFYDTWQQDNHVWIIATNVFHCFLISIRLYQKLDSLTVHCPCYFFI